MIWIIYGFFCVTLNTFQTIRKWICIFFLSALIVHSSKRLHNGSDYPLSLTNFELLVSQRELVSHSTFVSCSKNWRTWSCRRTHSWRVCKHGHQHVNHIFCFQWVIRNKRVVWKDVDIVYYFEWKINLHQENQQSWWSFKISIECNVERFKRMYRLIN